MRKKKKSEALALVKQSREREPVGRSCVFKRRTDYDRRAVKRELRRELGI